MGKRWKPYRVGIYRLGTLNGQAVATWRDASGRHRERLGRVQTEAEARGRLNSFAHARAAQVVRTSGRTVAAIFASYRKDREIDGKQIAAFDWNWKALKATFADLAPEHVTADVCRSYAALRLSEGVQAGTVWTELTRLRSALNWAAKRRLIDWPPPYVWVPTKPAARERVLTDAEVDRLIAGCTTLPGLQAVSWLRRYAFSRCLLGRCSCPTVILWMSDRPQPCCDLAINNIS